MLSGPFPKLAVGSIAANLADQMMLALLPLLLVAAGHDARTISRVVAAHAAAWLIASLPVGAYADAISRRTIMTWGALAIITGGAAGTFMAAQGLAEPWVLAVIAFVIATGVVMCILSVFALVPKILTADRLPSANAFLEFGRAAVCIASPLIAARLVSHQLSAWAFALACAGGALTLAATRMLPKEAQSTTSVSLLQSIRDGAAFVIGEPILRAIALCAIAWNTAFFALTAVFAPYAAETLGLDVKAIGNAWSLYGIGLLLGSLVAAPMIRALPTGFMFIFGPVTSCVSVLVLAALATRATTWPAYLALFALGFGPMTWLVLQTSVRQILTPQAMLGRVGATITTTIYGVRPLGALLAGSVAMHFGVAAALWLSVVLFFISCLALILSPAARLSSMPVRPA